MKLSPSFRLKPTDRRLLELMKVGDEKLAARRLGLPLSHIKKKIRKLKNLKMM